MKNEIIALPSERIEGRIFLIRGTKVMIDRDLAELYAVSTGELNQAVRRNIKRFPADFMFQLSKPEAEAWFSRFQIGTSKPLPFRAGTPKSLSSQLGTPNLKSQNVISSWGGTRKLPYVFTELGVAMLSSVLRSERAIQVNIQIMRTFIKLKEMVSSNKELRLKIEAMEKKYDKKFRIVFDALKNLLVEEEKPKAPIGFARK